MRLAVLVLSVLLTSLTSISQPVANSAFFSEEGTWLNTDSALTMVQLTRRNPLLIVTWQESDPIIPDVARMLKIASSQYPSLGIVGHVSMNTADADQMRKWHELRVSQWDFPAYVSQSDSSGSKGVSYTFISPKTSEGDALKGSIHELSAFRLSLDSWMNDVASMGQSPGSYIYKHQTSVEDLQLMSNPSGLVVDSEYEFIFISDTGHDRILLMDTEGGLIRTIGTGVPGSNDGSFSEASFFRPDGLAYDSETRVVYVADRGNSAIRILDVESETVTTLELQDNGNSISLSAPPAGLTLSGNQLTVSCPSQSSFYNVDLSTSEIKRIFGSRERGSELSKNPLKSQIESASAHCTENALECFLDNRQGHVFLLEDNRARLIISDDSLQAIENQAIFYPQTRALRAMTFHEGKLVFWNALNSEKVEIDPYTLRLEEKKLSGAVAPKTLSSAYSSKEKLYFLDPISSMVYVNEGNEMERLLFSNRERAIHITSQSDLFIPLNTVSIKPSGQTSLKLEPIIPPHFSYNPQSPCYAYVNSGKGAGAVLEGSLESNQMLLAVFPDVKGNQINISFEVNFCEKSDPWSCYQRWVTVNIPVEIDPEAEASQELELELFKGL